MIHETQLHLRLDEFENCMLDMIQQVQFKTNHHPSGRQRKLGKDLKEIREDKYIFVNCFSKDLIVYI